MRRGTLVSYRSLAGGVFDGVLTCDVRPDGTVALDVNVPGCREDPLSLNKVRWSDEPSTYARTAWPREGT